MSGASGSQEGTPGHTALDPTPSRRSGARTDGGQLDSQQEEPTFSPSESRLWQCPNGAPRSHRNLKKQGHPGCDKGQNAAMQRLMQLVPPWKQWVLGWFCFLQRGEGFYSPLQVKQLVHTGDITLVHDICLCSNILDKINFTCTTFLLGLPFIKYEI